MDSALARLVLRLSSAAEGMDESADQVLGSIRRLVEEGADDEELDRASAQLAHTLAAHAGSDPDAPARLAQLAPDLAGLQRLVPTLPVRGDEQERLTSLLQRARSAAGAAERQRALAEFIAMATDSLRDVSRRDDEPASVLRETRGGAEQDRYLRLVKTLLLQLVRHLDVLHGNALRSHALRERLQHISHADQLEFFIDEMGEELKLVDEQVQGERRRLADFLGELRDRLDGCGIELQQLGDLPAGSADAGTRATVLRERLESLRDESASLGNEIRNKIDIALKDPLTGVYGREGFDERCAELMERWKETGLGFSVVLVECPDFQTFNEQRGHACGDRLLVWIADLLQSRARGGDVVCRHQPDRFVILLPGTGVEGAEAFADSSCEAVAQRGFEDRGEVLQPRLVCGVTRLVAGDTPESVIGRAGEALYEARKPDSGHFVTVT